MTPHPAIYGLIGYPVKHSLSPAMHNAAFKALRIDAEYRLFEISPASLKEFLTCLREKDIGGLNVTIPHKEKVIPFLHSLSNEARLIGAVNTIKVFDDRLEGFNTDGEGFLSHLSKDLRFSPLDKNIAIIGAGGAARAVAVYLSRVRPRKISIYDIDNTKTTALVNHLKENFKDIDFTVADTIEGLNIKESDLLVNATPIGMNETDPCLVSEKVIHRDLLVYDLIYNPKQTKLLALAKKIGAKTSCGLGTLLYQGMRSFEIWTGRTAPKEVMQRALEFV